MPVPGMFAAIGRSFRLIRESAKVLRQDPELIWLTLGSFAAVIFVVVVLGGLGLSRGDFGDAGQQGSLTGTGLVLIGLSYFLGYFFVIYFQVALVAAVMHRLDGADPDLGYAIGQANRRLGAILVWALIAASVGLLFRILEGMARTSGRRASGAQIIALIVLSVLKFGWTMMVFFVVPVIVVENTSGIEAIKRSSSTLKRKWGEAVVGNQGLGLVTFLALLILAGVPGALGLMVMESSTFLGIILFIFAAFVGIFVTAFGAALDSTYRALLYRYATVGDTGGFSKTILDTAFRPKQDMRGAF